MGTTCIAKYIYIYTWFVYVFLLEKNLAVIQNLVVEFQYVLGCNSSLWFAAKFVLWCLEKLLGEIIPKDGVKYHFYAAIHDFMSFALGNLQLFLCWGRMTDTCSSVRCHNHVILNPGIQVIKLVSPSWPCICDNFFLLNFDFSQRWGHTVFLQGHDHQAQWLFFSPWPVSVVYSFNFINLVMRGRCQVLLYTHKFQAKTGNSISKSSLRVTSCMTEFIWLQLHGGICYFTKNSAQHCRWGVEKVNEELKRKINKY